MEKQLKFNKKEKAIIQDSINAISLILLKKQEKGVEKPELEGEVNITDIKKTIKFNFILE